jgi:hypothetical protein
MGTYNFTGVGGWDHLRRIVKRAQNLKRQASS